MTVVDEGLMTVNDAAAFLAVTRATVYAMMRAGTVPYVYIGSVRRIPRAAIKSLVLTGLINGPTRA